MHPTRIFKEPNDILKAFEEYKADLKIKENEWLKVQYVGKNGSKVEDPLKLPLTMEGFERYCHEHYGTVSHYFNNTDNYYEDFCTICSRIKTEIRENQITGGLLNVFNPSITQRLNGLVDKTDNNHSVKVEQITGMEIK